MYSLVGPQALGAAVGGWCSGGDCCLDGSICCCMEGQEFCICDTKCDPPFIQLPCQQGKSCNAHGECMAGYQCCWLPQMGNQGWCAKPSTCTNAGGTTTKPSGATPGFQLPETGTVEVCSPSLPCKSAATECCYWLKQVPTGVVGTGACVIKGTCESLGGSKTPPQVGPTPPPPLPPPPPKPAPKPAPTPTPTPTPTPAPPSTAAPEDEKFLGVSPLVLVAGAAAAGLLGYAIYKKKKGKKAKKGKK